MTTETTQFIKHRSTSGKIRVMNVLGTIGFHSFEITTAAEIEKSRLQWGLKSVPGNIDNFFSWEKFIAAYDAAVDESVDEILQQWGILERVSWQETVVDNTAMLLARHVGTHVVVEKVLATDAQLGPIEYFVISAAP
jgi:hypothetical protein